MGMLLALCLAVGPAAARPGRVATTSRSAPSPGRLLPPPRPAGAGPIRKITPPTPAEAARNRATAMAWYRQARKDVTPALHLVESANFLVFSTWPRSADQRLREVCEKMHAHLRKQFAMPRSQSVWAGKLPVFIFSKVEDFKRFTDEVDRQKMSASGGYLMQRSDGFCYIVLNKVHSRTHFYGLLVHEATHAFLARYQTNGFLPVWLNEGLAETMSAQLVPGCGASWRYVHATGRALRGNRPVAGVFKEVRLGDFDYGVAQSLVRFLLARSRKDFVKLVRLLKAGVEEAEALKLAYGLTHRELVEEWRRASRKALRRTR